MSSRAERVGIAAGIVSSAMGGMAAAVTRFSVATIDPVLVTVFRFGIGCLLLLPVAFAMRVRWPRGLDLLATAALGVLFYGGFFVVYAHALTITTAARGSLGVATLPVLTMLVAAALRREHLTARKSIGVLVALGGVAMSLITDLRSAPVGAWRGDLMMIAAMLSMSLYTIYSRPLMGRSSALGYACIGMAAGSLLNLGFAAAGSGWAEFRLWERRSGQLRCSSGLCRAPSASFYGSTRFRERHQPELQRRSRSAPSAPALWRCSYCRSPSALACC